MAHHGRKPPDPTKVKPRARDRVKPPPPPAHVSRKIPSSDGCCPMVAAVRSVKRGKYRLASRYARLSVRLIAERIA